MSITKKQVAGGFLSVKWVQNPELCEPYLKNVAEVGYNSWMCVIRHMNLNVFDQSVKDAIAVLVETAHKYGLKFILDTDPTHWAETLTARNLDASLQVLIPVKVDVFNGRFETFVKQPKGDARQADIVEVSAAYEMSGGSYKDILPELKLEWEHALMDGCGFHLKGSFREDFNGTAKIYLNSSIISMVDHGSQVLFDMQREMLEFYKDIPIDGVAWDEPGKGHGDMTRFRTGVDFFPRFERTNGYDLKEKLIYLDEFDESPEAVKVRCDYYRTLSDMHYEVQYEHNKQAKEQWGDDIILGTHHTWSGLPTDLAAGVFDHFRLGELLSEAWTDGGFEFERKIIMFPFILADSLKKGLAKPNAYYNDWIFRPDPAQYHLMNRLKTIYNINTFNHVHSDFSEGLVSLQVEPMKTAVESDVPVLDKLNDFLGDKLGESQFAVWYGWEGYACLPKKYARTLYTFFQNISLLFTDASMYIDFVSSELLDAAEIKDGLLCTRGGKYKALVLPYARVLPPGLWEKLLEWADQGIKIVFVGPEPAFTSDGGLIDFGAAAGFSSHGLQSYEKFMQGIAIDAWEPPFVDSDPEPKIINIEDTVKHTDRFGQMTALGSHKDIYWIPGLDPREDLINMLSMWHETPIKVYGNCIWRIFRKDDANDFVIILAPRQGTPGWGIVPDCKMSTGDQRYQIKLSSFDGIIDLGDKQFKFSDCEWAAIQFKNGKIVDALIEGDEFKIS